jgi:hypothetical protein
MSKYIFKILQKEDDVLIIVHNDIDKFIGTVNQDTFKLPYLKNKDVLKFVTKILNKYSDDILKLDYSIENIDASNIKLNITIYDGQKHLYEIILKAKDNVDEEKLEEKINNIKNIYNSKILDLDRKYDDMYDELKKKINIENINLESGINNKYMNNEYRNYKFKSFQIIKNMNKINKSIEINEELEELKYTKMNDNFFIKIYDELKRYNDFINFIFMKYNEKHTNDPIKKTRYVYNYLVESNIYNFIEFLLNIHGTIKIIYLNIDFNKGTQKLILSIKFLSDISESRIYKCLPSLYNQDLSECKLIYHNSNISNISNNTNPKINVFIFEKLK